MVLQATGGEGVGVTLSGMQRSDKDYQLRRLENTLASIEHELGEVRKVLRLVRETEKSKYEVKVEPKKEERKAYSQDE